MAKYLEDESDQGQILALVVNQLGDHQMETYFRSTGDSNGGMICQSEFGIDDIFEQMEDIHRKSFQDIGGKYIPRGKNEKTCAIRLAPNTFFKVMLGNRVCDRGDKTGKVESSKSDLVPVYDYRWHCIC